MTRCEIDLADIKEEYERISGRKLLKAIEVGCSNALVLNQYDMLCVYVSAEVKNLSIHLLFMVKFLPYLFIF